jgi:FkbM family methyltransferase
MMLSRLVKDTLRAIVPLSQKQLLIRYALANSMEIGIAKLVSKGFHPGGIIDVGAYHGEWSKIAARIIKDVPILMIEAQPAKHQPLSQVARKLGPQVTLEIALLSTHPHQVPFYVMETGSSMYPENTTAPRKQVIMDTKTLDAVVGRQTMLKPPYLLKLDVQGAELDVLRGGAATLAQAMFVILEVSIMRYNSGSPLFMEVATYMEQANFAIYDILGLHRLPRSNELCQMDVIFIHKDSSFLPAT